MKKRRHIIIGLLATATVACSTSHDEPTAPDANEQAPILLSVSEASSRASSLGDKYNDFGVWAWKKNPDGSQSPVLGRAPAADAGTEYYTYLVDGRWTYEYTHGDVTQYLRYWDRAATNYYFSAYSPYKKGETAVNTTHTILATTAGVSISPVSGNVPLASGIDWLEARWERQTAPALKDIDRVSGEEHDTHDLTDAVPLVFHHILAQTEFRIYSGSDNALSLKSLSITLSDAQAILTQAHYTAGTWSYADDATATAIYNLPDGTELDISGTTKEKYHSLTTLLQLPQNVNGRTLCVNATTTEGKARSGSFELAEGWEREKIYIYYLCIKGDEILLMDFVVDDWASGGDIEISDPIINW